MNVKSKPTTPITVKVIPPRPAVITGLVVRGAKGKPEFSGRDCIFDWRPCKSVATASGPAGQEAYGAGTGNVDPFIKGYYIEVWVNNARVYSEHVPRNTYTYSFDKNTASNKGKPQRTFTLKVWAEDKYNQLSPSPAILKVTNPLPAAVGNKVAVERFSPGAPVPWSASGLTLDWADKAHRTILLKWEPVADADVVGYRIYRRQYLLNETSDAPITFSGGAPSETYYWRTTTTPSFTDRAPTLEQDDNLILTYYCIVPYDSFGADIKTNVLGQAKITWSMGSYYRKN